MSVDEVRALMWIAITIGGIAVWLIGAPPLGTGCVECGGPVHKYRYPGRIGYCRDHWKDAG